ncbi:MAG: GNAT family N-acetyltransferase [Anaerolineales bacterium]|nr:GNAT family N-acetyltransferase [Anaerolineales bacterium]
MSEENIRLIITPLRPQDQVAARRLILAGLEERWGSLDSLTNPDLDDLGEHYRQAIFLLAWLGDELVGSGALIAEAPGIGRIVRMSVARLHRRTGIGQQILAALLSAARERGYHQLVLETTSTWQNAIHFYQGQGFYITGEKDGDTHLKLDL